MITASRVTSSSSSSHTHSYNAGHTPIPAAAKKVVQNLKEIVKNHSEEEIYSTLKECNMDPDDAVHRLMNQDTFHEVRRKRDRKRENGNKNDVRELSISPSDGKVLKPSGSKPNYVPRHTLGDASGNCGNQIICARENGNSEVTNTTSVSQSQPQSQSMLNIPEASNAPVHSGFFLTVNGRSSYARPQGNWAKVSTNDIKFRGSQLSSSSTEGNLVKGLKQRNVTRSASLGLNSRSFSGSEAYLSDGLRKFWTGRPGGRGGVYNNYYSGRNIYQQQHSLALGVKATTQLEWKPKTVVAQPVSSQPALDVGGKSQSSLPADVSSMAEEKSTLLYGKTESARSMLQADRPVIIPDHLQVSEAEFVGLRFGSFDLEVSVAMEEGPTSTSEDTTATASISEIAPEEADTGVMKSDPVLVAPEKARFVSSDNLVTSTDTVLDRQPAMAAQVEITKPDTATMQPNWQPSFPSGQQGMGLLPPQISYETVESLPQEVSRLPSFVPFSDPAMSYFSPLARPTSDSDSRYQYVSSNVPTKFSSGNVPLMNSGQNISSSQEGTIPGMQLSRTAGVSHTTLSMPQPPYAYAAQPAGLTISPYATNVFGYQFVPPRYAYLHAPYQHNYSGNIGYHQTPGGSSYMAGARGYPPGAAAFKYAPLHYKTGTAPVSGPHAVVPSGYGSFGGAAAATPGYATISPTATAASASNYDDMVGPQYKESSYYTPAQQGEGSAVWIPTPLSRDVSGMQTSSFYNVHNQGQHAGYTHPQHSHPYPAAGFASFYHLPQSTPGPSTPQVLQQPQTISSIGMAGSQGVIYHQTQHGGQLSWPSSYTNLIRNQ